MLAQLARAFTSAVAAAAITIPSVPASAHDLIRRPPAPAESSAPQPNPAHRVCESFLYEKFDARARMAQTLASAVARVALIKTTIAASPPELREYAKDIVLAIEAAVTKHQAEFDEEKFWQTLDTGRHFAILSDIANFDPAKPKWSLYKIKRTIEEKHSLREYVKCK